MSKILKLVVFVGKTGIVRSTLQENIAQMLHAYECQHICHIVHVLHCCLSVTCTRVPPALTSGQAACYPNCSHYTKLRVWTYLRRLFIKQHRKNMFGLRTFSEMPPISANLSSDHGSTSNWSGDRYFSMRRRCLGSAGPQ